MGTTHSYEREFDTRQYYDERCHRVYIVDELERFLIAAYGVEDELVLDWDYREDKEMLILRNRTTKEVTFSLDITKVKNEMLCKHFFENCQLRKLQTNPKYWQSASGYMLLQLKKEKLR